MAGLADFLRDLSGVRVLVLGDALVDGYLEGETITPRGGSSTPVVAVRRHLDQPGGAAGAAAAVAALGGRARLLSVVGDDPEGRELRRRLTDAGVDARFNLSGSRRTLIRRRVGDEAGPLVRYDEGDVAPIPPANEAWLLDQLPGVWPQADAVLVLDDGHGVMTPAVRAELRRLQLTDPRLLVVDPHDAGAYAGAGLSVCVLDAHEALLLVGALDGRRRVASLEEHAGALLSTTGAQLVAVRLGQDGAFFAEAGGPAHRTYERHVPARESSGGAPTFDAALTLALGAGAQTWAAAEAATAAAAVAASKGRTAVCDTSELRLRLSPLEKVMPDVHRLAAELDDRRAHGQRIVLTAGWFGDLHRGHATLLERARAAGDLLVVGVRSGADRGDGGHARRSPSPAEDRIAVLAGLSCVDAIVPLADGGPDELIRTLRPHVVVAGDGADGEKPLSAAARDAEADLVLVPRVPDVSAQSLLERIRTPRRLARLSEEAA